MDMVNAFYDKDLHEVCAKYNARTAFAKTTKIYDSRKNKLVYQLRAVLMQAKALNRWLADENVIVNLTKKGEMYLELASWAQACRYILGFPMFYERRVKERLDNDDFGREKEECRYILGQINITAQVICQEIAHHTNYKWIRGKSKLRRLIHTMAYNIDLFNLSHFPEWFVIQYADEMIEEIERCGYIDHSDITF